MDGAAPTRKIEIRAASCLVCVVFEPPASSTTLRPPRALRHPAEVSWGALMLRLLRQVLPQFLDSFVDHGHFLAVLAKMVHHNFKLGRQAGNTKTSSLTALALASLQAPSVTTGTRLHRAPRRCATHDHTTTRLKKTCWRFHLSRELNVRFVADLQLSCVLTFCDTSPAQSRFQRSALVNGLKERKYFGFYF